MATTKKVKPVGDVTRTARAKAHLERLTEAKGRRLLVDLDAEGSQDLDALLEAGYEKTNRGVVSRALNEAAARLKKMG